MKNNQNIGDMHRLEHGLHFDEHEFFYEYLLISPSYQLAHQFMTGQIKDAAKIEGVANWNKVLQTYAMCGDVYSMPFLKWWDSTGRKIFYTQQTDGTYLPQGSFSLLTNKVNVLTLVKGFLLVNNKSSTERFEGKRIENWRLGVESNVPSKWTQQLKRNSKKTHDNLEARTTLGILVSKKLKEALYLAENAARGEFPSITPVASGLEFDYDQIYEVGKTMSQLFLQEWGDRTKAGLGFHKPAVVKKYQRKQKAEKKIQIEVERQIKLRTGKA
jgi:hypothetical protein